MSDISSESDSSLSTLISTSSSDELEDFIMEERIRPKNKDYYEVTIPQYNEQEFIEHFRVSPNVANLLVEKFETSRYYNYQAGPYGKFTALQETYIFLWFVGHQTASFRDVADRFNITISSLFRITRRLIYFVSNLSIQIIKWPTEEDKISIEEHFRQKGFPNVIGVIDGSHIKIDKPIDDPDSYINRKGFYSIQVQLVCDHKLRILDVFVGYPGSVHDSRVFRNLSPLFQTLEEKYGAQYILGDSGYPVLPNLLTPFKDRGNLTRQQINYNIKLSKNRYLIEHCIVLLKQKFRQLYHAKLRQIPDIVHLIRACCVLHNMALLDGFQLEENVQEENHLAQNLNDQDNDPDEEPEDRNGAMVRNTVLNMLEM